MTHIEKDVLQKIFAYWMDRYDQGKPLAELMQKYPEYVRRCSSDSGSVEVWTRETDAWYVRMLADEPDRLARLMKKAELMIP